VTPLPSGPAASPRRPQKKPWHRLGTRPRRHRRLHPPGLCRGPRRRRDRRATSQFLIRAVA